MLVPPVSFGLVEEGIYRCSKVETLNLSFLETLNLKIIVFLSGEEPSRFFKDFFKSCSIEWIAINPNSYTTLTSSGLSNSTITNDGDNSTTKETLQSLKDESNGAGTKKLTSSIANDYSTNLESNGLMLLNSTVLQKIFLILLDQSNYNCLLVDKSSIVIGVLRKILKWNISSIINEYRLFSGKNRNYFSESFLELVKINMEQRADRNVSQPINDESTSVKTQREDSTPKGSERVKRDALNLTPSRCKLESLVVKDEKVLTKEEEKEKKEENKGLNHRMNFHDCKNLNIKGTTGTRGTSQIRVLSEKDLDTFEPEVPALLLAMIADVEKIQKREREMIVENEASSQKTSDEQDHDKNDETGEHQMSTLQGNNAKYNSSHSSIKKSASMLGVFGSKYRLAFDKPGKSDYEYYKSNDEKKLEEQNEKIKHETIISNSVSRMIKDKQNNNNQRPKLITLTISPKIYSNKEQQWKNQKILEKYGANIHETDNETALPFNAGTILDESAHAKHPFTSVNSDSAVDGSPGHADEPSSLSQKSSTNSVDLLIPKEEFLPEWFKLQRDIWEKNNTIDYYTESVFSFT